MADLSGVLERVLDVGERGLGITEHPRRQGSPSERGRADVVAKARRQCTVLRRIVQRDGAIEMRAALRDVSHKRERNAHEKVSEHQRDRGVLAPSKLQELGCKPER
jgi:hypothetical protein